MKIRLANNQELAHVWASQSQAEGRASHMFFDGPSIYSYGHHFEIACIVQPGIVFFNPKRYSISTAKHQSRARSAVSHMKVFTVPSMTDHNENVAYLLKELADELARISRMRTNGDFWLEQYAKQVENAWEYAALFKISKPLFNQLAAVYEKRENPLTPEVLAKLKARAKASREAKAKATTIRKAKLQADYDEWKNGVIDNLTWEAINLFPVALRVKDNEIQTTKGATVPVIEARKLWHVLKAGEPIANMRVGHYTVTDIRDENLVIGCHTIPLSEIDRMA